jgi:tetratricopeptide (TPR) repeat protein
MTAPDCGKPNEPSSHDAGNDSARRAKTGRASRPKRWYEKTSVTLCVAAALVVIGLGFVHVILGVTSFYGLPFDIVLRKSFGYREAIVDVQKLGDLPYAVARFKYPLSVAALQKRGYIEGGPAFEARMMARQRECTGRWQSQFESSLGRPTVCWQDCLRGQEQASDSDPENPQACNQRGIAFARSGEYQAALAEFTRAIRRDPTYADAFYNRALVSIEIGNVGQAASDLGTVVEIKPGFVEGRIRRGQLCMAMDEQDKAIEEFTKAVEITPQCAEALFHRSMVHYVKGDYEKALEDVHRVEDLGVIVPIRFVRALRGELDMDRVVTR